MQIEANGGGACIRLAGFRDSEKLAQLYSDAWNVNESPESVKVVLEQGGAMVLERNDGLLLGALRWREHEEGWLLERIATLPNYREHGFGRWLMTTVEAYAIKQNVASLSMTIRERQEELVPYYSRMGYLSEKGEGNDVHLHKRVGGLWQMQG